MSFKDFIHNLFVNYIPLAVSLFVIWSLIFGMPAFAKNLYRKATGAPSEAAQGVDGQSGVRENGASAMKDRPGLPPAQDRLITFARDISRDDPQVLALAYALSTTNMIPKDLDFSEFLLDEIGERAAPDMHMTALILALTELSMTDPDTHLVYFDWREDVSAAARSLDGLLSRRSSADGAIAASINAWPDNVKYERSGVETALAAALGPFLGEGLILLDISPPGGWDAHLIAAVPVAEAQIWANTILVHDENTPLRKGAHVTSGQRLASRFIRELRPPGVRQPEQTSRSDMDVFMLANDGDYMAMRRDKFTRSLTGLSEEQFERRWVQARREGLLSESEIGALTPDNMPRAVVDYARAEGRLTATPRDLTLASLWEVYDQQWLVRMTKRTLNPIPLSAAERAHLTEKMTIIHAAESRENAAAGLELFFGTLALRNQHPLMIDIGGEDVLVTFNDKQNVDFWLGQSLGDEDHLVRLRSPFELFGRQRFEFLERKELQTPLLRRFMEDWRDTMPAPKAAILTGEKIQRIAANLDAEDLFGTARLPVYFGENGPDIRELLDYGRESMEQIADQYGISLPDEDWLEQLFADQDFDRHSVGFLEGFGLDKLDEHLRAQGWALGIAAYQEYENQVLFVTKSEIIDHWSRTHFGSDFLVFNNADFWKNY